MNNINDEILTEIVYNDIVIETDFIRLDQFLKLSNMAPSGGIAKLIILDGLVSVNGEKCLLRGKKLYSDDKVLFLRQNEFENEKDEYFGFLVKNHKL